MIYIVNIYVLQSLNMLFLYNQENYNVIQIRVSYIHCLSLKCHQPYLLLDEAEEFLNRIEESLANSCINKITNDTSQLRVPNMLSSPHVNEDSLAASSVIIHAQLPVPMLSSPKDINGRHCLDADVSLDKIQVGEIMSNWANEYVKNLGFTNKQNSSTSQDGITS